MFCQLSNRPHSRHLALVLLAAFLWTGCSDFGDAPTDPGPGSTPPGDVSLDSIVPVRTYTGGAVVLHGSGFGEQTGNVLFSAPGSATAEATIQSWTDTEISAVVPAAAVPGPVVVEVDGARSEAVAFAVAPEVSLQQDVRPIFTVQGCLSCHGGSGGLFLDSRAAILAGGGRGPGVVPGNSSESNVIRAVRGEGLPLMPQGALESIPEVQILTIADWIDQGARDN
jgi:hypothetical protein